MRSAEIEANKQQYLFEGLEGMLNPKHPLVRLAKRYPWDVLEEELSSYYSAKGRPAKRIRLMAGLLLLKQMYDLGDETIVEAWVQNPYYQYLCGEQEFRWNLPCDPTDLVHFRNRIGSSGVEKIFQHSVELHGDKSAEKVVHADTTVQEKNITFPTDVKLYRKVIVHCWRIVDKEGIVLRQRYTRIVRSLLLQQRNRNHAKNYKAAMRAQRKLKTIAGRLMREIMRKMCDERMKEYAESLGVCMRILQQKKNDTNKIYSLHEPAVYCVSKGKERKSYEFGCKVSILKTEKSGVIVGAMSFAANAYDGHTLEPALTQYKKLFATEPQEVVVDRGYKGKSQINQTRVSTPKPLPAGTSYQQAMRIRKKFRRRAGIEPVIGHLKEDCRLGRNYLKGIKGDMINVLLAAAAYNLRKWMRELRNFLSTFIQLILNMTIAQKPQLSCG